MASNYSQAKWVMALYGGIRWKSREAPKLTDRVPDRQISVKCDNNSNPNANPNPYPIKILTVTDYRKEKKITGIKKSNGKI